MRNPYYRLEGKVVVPCKDVLEWATEIEKKKSRHVAQTEKGEVRVSTVFLGLDHARWGGTPEIFETMVFGGEYDQDMERYATWDEAEAGHKRMCKKCLLCKACSVKRMCEKCFKE